MRDTLRYVRTKRKVERSIVKDAYELTGLDKGLIGKIAGWLFKQLFKRGYLKQHFHEMEYEVFDYTFKEKEQLTDKILDVIKQQERAGYGYPDPAKYVIVMGERTFFETVKHSKIDGPFFINPMSFSANPLYHSDPYNGRQAFHWKVHVVPSMEGFAFIPKAIVEVKR
jgi:hypothetical protein